MSKFIDILQHSIGIIFLIFTLVLIMQVSALTHEIDALDETETNPQYNYVKCYDRNYNEIQGAVCLEEVYSDAKGELMRDLLMNVILLMFCFIPGMFFTFGDFGRPYGKIQNKKQNQGDEE